jgi:hypothetical protein
MMSLNVYYIKQYSLFGLVVYIQLITFNAFIFLIPTLLLSLFSCAWYLRN